MSKKLVVVLAAVAMIVGMATVSQAQVNGPVPVPDTTVTIILLGAAVLGLGLVGRKRE
ncbi:MAG: hypothetical protein V1929_08295 [bacterium]